MKLKRRSLWFQAIVLIICLALSFLSFSAVHRLAQIRSNENFQVLVDQGVASLERRIALNEHTLNGLAGLYVASDHVTSGDMSDYAAALGVGDSTLGICAIGFATVSPVTDDALIHLAADGDVSSETADAPVDAPKERVVVRYIEPQIHHQITMADAFSDNADLLAIAKAARASRKTSLVPYFEIDRSNGINSKVALLIKPIYRAAQATTASSQRPEAFSGFVFVVLEMGAVLDNLIVTQNKLIDLTVWAGPLSPQTPAVYQTGGGVAGFEPAYVRVQTIQKYGQMLTLRWQSTPRFDFIQPFRARWIVLAMCLLVTALVSSILHIMLRRESTITSLVDQKSRELETRQKEQHSIIENAMLAILSLAPSGLILHANETAQQLLDVGANRIDATGNLPSNRSGGLTGRTISSLLPTLDLDRADGRFKLSTFLSPTDSEPSVIEVEKNTWMTSEGDTRVTVMLRDITVSEHHSMEIAKTEQRWNLALMGAQIGVFDIDLKRKTSVVSDVWYKIMSIDPHPDCPDPYASLLDHVHPEDRDSVKRADTICAKGPRGRAGVRFRINGDQGDWRWIQSDAVVVERATDGTALRMVGTQIDITESVKLEQMKRDFVATVSHELRTPLTSIKGALGLLDAKINEADPEMSQRLIQIALSNSDRLVSIVNDILDMEKINAGSMTVTPKVESLSHIMRLASDQVGPYALQWNVELEVEIPQVDASLWVDQKRVIQVLTNLLSNACKFAHTGTKVRLTADILPSEVRISVHNFGPGIPEDFRSKIFHPFTQADSSDARQKGGTGLGLNISRQLTKAMGGQIGFESAPGEKTMFWFTCPLADDTGLGPLD